MTMRPKRASLRLKLCSMSGASTPNAAVANSSKEKSQKRLTRGKRRKKGAGGAGGGGGGGAPGRGGGGRRDPRGPERGPGKRRDPADDDDQQHEDADRGVEGLGLDDLLVVGEQAPGNGGPEPGD